MENAKKVLMAVVTFAGAIYGLYEFYKEHECEIKEIVNPLIKSCEEIKDIKLIAEQNGFVALMGMNGDDDKTNRQNCNLNGDKSKGIRKGALLLRLGAPSQWSPFCFLLTNRILAKETFFHA